MVSGMVTFMDELDPLSVTCPVCAAGPHQSCATTSREQLEAPHPLRGREARYRSQCKSTAGTDDIEDAVRLAGSVRALVDRASVPRSWVRKGLYDAGAEPRPRGRLPVTETAIRERLKRIGEQTDREVAEANGVSISTVKRARKRFGIRPANYRNPHPRGPNEPQVRPLGKQPDYLRRGVLARKILRLLRRRDEPVWVREMQRDTGASSNTTIRKTLKDTMQRHGLVVQVSPDCWRLGTVTAEEWAIIDEFEGEDSAST